MREGREDGTSLRRSKDGTIKNELAAGAKKTGHTHGDKCKDKTDKRHMREGKTKRKREGRKDKRARWTKEIGGNMPTRIRRATYIFVETGERRF